MIASGQNMFKHIRKRPVRNGQIEIISIAKKICFCSKEELYALVVLKGICYLILVRDMYENN